MAGRGSRLSRRRPGHAGGHGGEGRRVQARADGPGEGERPRRVRPDNAAADGGMVQDNARLLQLFAGNLDFRRRPGNTTFRPARDRMCAGTLIPGNAGVPPGTSGCLPMGFSVVAGSARVRRLSPPATRRFAVPCR